MRFRTYPRKDEYVESWARISRLCIDIWSELEARHLNLQQANNVLALDQKAAEDWVRQAFERIDREEADRGEFREVYLVNFKSPRGNLRIDLRGGYATLPLRSETIIPISNPTIAWEASSEQGIPGNLAEILGWERGKGNNAKVQPIVAWGDGDPVALTDNNSETHFEWERSLLDNPQQIAGNDGAMATVKEVDPFELIKPDRWTIKVPERGPKEIRVCDDRRDPGFKGPLRLVVQGDAGSEATANYLEIVPYYPKHVSAPPFLLERVESVGGTQRDLIAREYRCSRPRSIQIDPTLVSSLRVYFSQQSSYRTSFAHKYYLKRFGSDVRFLWTGSPTYAGEVARVPAVTAHPDAVIDNSWETELASYPNTEILNTFVYSTASKILLDSGVVTGNVDPLETSGVARVGSADTTEDWDIFTGERYSIGIREIRLLRREFEARASAEFGPFDFDQPASYLSITSTVTIPEQFGSGDWIKLYVSSDGITWSAVVEGTIIDFPYRRAYLRVEMERPGDQQLASPLLHELRLYVS